MYAPMSAIGALSGLVLLTLSSSHFDPERTSDRLHAYSGPKARQLPSPAIAQSGSRSPKHVAEHPSDNDKDDAHSERQQAAVDPPAHEATTGLCRKYCGNEPEHGGFSDQQQELTNVDRKHLLLPRNTPTYYRNVALKVTE